MATYIGLENLLPQFAENDGPGAVDGYPWTNVFTDDSYRYYLRNGLTDTFYRLDDSVIANNTVTGLGVANHNLTSFNFKDEADDNPEFELTIPSSNTGNAGLFKFDEFVGSSDARLFLYNSPTEAMRIGMLWMGELLKMPRGVSGRFSRPSQARKWTVQATSGRGGSVIGSKNYEQAKDLTLSFSNISQTFLETTWQDILDHCFNQNKPIWVLWDSENHNGEGFVGYPITTPAPPIYSPFDTATVSLQLRGI